MRKKKQREKNLDLFCLEYLMEVYVEWEWEKGEVGWEKGAVMYMDINDGSSFTISE